MQYGTLIIKIRAIFIAAVAVLAVAYPTRALAAFNIVVPDKPIYQKDCRDYASKTFGDPWDMNNREDISPLVKNFSYYYVSNGKFIGKTKTNDAYFWLIWGGFPGSVAIGRDGTRHPINTSTYRRLTIKMYVSNSSANQAQVYWFYKQNLRYQKVHSFPVYPGWRIYQVDLPQNVLSRKFIGLRLDPVNRPSTRVEIDWVRLTDLRDGDDISLTWYDTNYKSGTASVYLTNDTDYQGSKIGSAYSRSGYTTYSFDSSGLMPGTYRIYVEKRGLKTAHSEEVKINQTPTVRFIDPDIQGGRDWATLYIRNAWNMSDRGDVEQTANTQSKWFYKGIFSGVNGGRTRNDPYFRLRTWRGRSRYSLDTSRFYMLTVKMRYDGSFDLRRGTMGRFGWKLPGTSWQMSDDIVVYPEVKTYTFDLRKVRVDTGRYGWRRRAVAFRFDPHEDPYRRRFYIDHISLREIDRLKTHFSLKWYQEDADNIQHQVTFYRDRDKYVNGNEARITGPRTFSVGRNSLRWTPNRHIKGSYFIHANISDGLDSEIYTSTGPLKVH